MLVGTTKYYLVRFVVGRWPACAFVSLGRFSFVSLSCFLLPAPRWPLTVFAQWGVSWWMGSVSGPGQSFWPVRDGSVCLLSPQMAMDGGVVYVGLVGRPPGSLVYSWSW